MGNNNLVKRFEADSIKKERFGLLFEGEDLVSGYKARLDIFTPLEPAEISSVIDRAYDKAENEYNNAPRPETFEADDKKHLEHKRTGRIIIPESYKLIRRIVYPLIIEEFSEKDEFMEGPKGPPLQKGKKEDGLIYHDIMKTIIQDNWIPYKDGNLNLRDNLSREEGTFIVQPFDLKSLDGILSPSSLGSFGFNPKSYMSLERFFFMMITFENCGNLSVGSDVLECLLEDIEAGATSTVEEGMIQRDALSKLTSLFSRLSIPYAVNLYNKRNKNSALVYAKNS